MANLIKPWSELSEKEHREFNKKGITAREMQLRKFKKPKLSIGKSVKRFCMLCMGIPEYNQLETEINWQYKNFDKIKLSDKCKHEGCPLHSYRTGKQPWIKCPKNKHNLDGRNESNPGANKRYHDIQNQ